MNTVSNKIHQMSPIWKDLEYENENSINSLYPIIIHKNAKTFSQFKMRIKWEKKSREGCEKLLKFKRNSVHRKLNNKV